MIQSSRIEWFRAKAAKKKTWNWLLFIKTNGTTSTATGDRDDVPTKLTVRFLSLPSPSLSSLRSQGHARISRQWIFYNDRQTRVSPRSRAVRAFVRGSTARRRDYNLEKLANLFFFSLLLSSPNITREAISFTSSLGDISDISAHTHTRSLPRQERYFAAF